MKETSAASGENEIALKNGLTVRFNHTAHRYFGDYHKLLLEISCEVAVTPEFFPDEQGYRQALAKLGATVSYRRVEEQMGVPTADVEQAVARMIDHFCAHTLRYFESPVFPQKLVHSELLRKERGRRPLVPMLAHG